MFIYRPSRFAPLTQCSVSLDGRWLHDIPVQGYETVLVAPGEHTLVTRWHGAAAAHLSFAAQAGRNYFFKIGIDREQIDQGTVTLSQEEESTGQGEVRALSRVPKLVR